MKFRDPDREAAVTMQRTAQLEDKLARVTQSRQKTFNIVSHEGPPRRVDSLPTLKKDHSSKRPYHILSNLPKPLHADAPTLYDEQFSVTMYKQTIIPRAQTRPAHEREFNVISNDYFENPVEKKRQEYERVREHVLDKYWRTHDFDIVKGHYYSPEKEQIYREQAKVLEEVQGRALERTLPPSVEYSDGHSYDIITHDVFDDTRLKATMTMADRSLARMKKLEKEAEFKQVGDKLHQQQEEKRMARIAHKRYESSLANGFNFITNELVSNPPRALPVRPPTMWGRLTMNQHHGDDNSPGAGRPPSYQPPATANSATGYMQRETGRMGTGEIARGRDLSGAAQHQASARAFTAQTSSRDRDFTQVTSSRSEHQLSLSNNHHNSMININSSNSNNRSSRVPLLDVTKAEFGEPVKYVEPAKAAPGSAIAMVRTGGLSSYR